MYNLVPYFSVTVSIAPQHFLKVWLAALEWLMQDDMEAYPVKHVDISDHDRIGSHEHVAGNVGDSAPQNNSVPLSTEDLVLYVDR